jgi:hypothetical protein
LLVKRDEAAQTCLDHGPFRGKPSGLGRLVHQVVVDDDIGAQRMCIDWPKNVYASSRVPQCYQRHHFYGKDDVYVYTVLPLTTFLRVLVAGDVLPTH